MPKCSKCEELFSVEDGEYNDDKEFMCAMCATDFKDDDIVDEDDEDIDLDEEDEDEKSEKVAVKPKACPGCKEKSVDYAESGICPDCGYEKDIK
jgi:uncharacterized Zn ribbon protein